MVVDGDVDELPAGTGSPAARITLAGTITCDAMADGIETSEFFDVDVNDLAGGSALVTWSLLLRLQRREQA